RPLSSPSPRLRPAAHSEPDFSLEACRRCLSEIVFLPGCLRFVAAPDGAAERAPAGRLSRSFSQLNWMMSSHGHKWKPELKADLRTVEQEMLDSGLVTSLVDLLLTLLRLRGAYDDDLATGRWSFALLQFGKKPGQILSLIFSPTLLNAQDGGQMLELNTASLVECALGIGYNIMTRSCTERLAEFPSMVDSAKALPGQPCHQGVGSTALIFIAFALATVRLRSFWAPRKASNYADQHPAAGTEGSGAGLRRLLAVAEMSKCINRLALNDANKDLLVELNVLSVVKLMLDSPEAQDVQEGLEISVHAELQPASGRAPSRRSF
uniref:WAPL domain-containing protein n=1 Tax=Macrostomum lignano TaxID=282301 RepID=A0A1I8FNN0_9PLAT